MFNRSQLARPLAALALLAGCAASDELDGVEGPAGPPPGVAPPGDAAGLLGPPGAASYDGQPPSGNRCSCWFTDCAGSSLHCTCDPACYEWRDDCLIFVQGGVSSSNDTLLSACEITCALVDDEQQDEFQIPTRMECDATNCGAPQDALPGHNTPTPAAAGCPVPVPGAMTVRLGCPGEPRHAYYAGHCPP